MRQTTTRHPLSLPALGVGLCVWVMLSFTSPVAAEPFGIVAHIPNREISDEIVAAGIQWVRIDFLWAAVELEQDQYDWAVYDELVSSLEERGLRIFATLQGTPAWATEGREFSGVPRNRNDWKDFCFRSASRYRGRIHAWGLWNEPNLARFWDGTSREYVEVILIAGALSLRTADPSGLICGPELAHLSSGRWDSWLQLVLNAAADYIDVITHHAYPSGTGASDVRDKLEGDPQWPWEPQSVRTILEQGGWADRPFWLTETGVESDMFGEEVQRTFYKDLLFDWFPARSQRTWVDRVFFYQMVDDARFPEVSFGILEEAPSLARKLAFTEYQTFIANSTIDDASLVGLSIPSFVAPGTPAPIRISFINTGTTTWTPEDIGLRATTDSPEWQLTESGWRDGSLIPPGEVAEFELTLEGPENWINRPPFPLGLSLRLERRDLWLFGPAAVRTCRVTSYLPVQILVQPRSRVLEAGSTSTLSITVDSDSSVIYRWRRNSVNLVDGAGVTGSYTPTLTLHNVDYHAVGMYDCVLVNRAGRLVSKAAELRLDGQPGPTDAPRRGRGPMQGGAHRAAEILERFQLRTLAPSAD